MCKGYDVLIYVSGKVPLLPYVILTIWNMSLLIWKGPTTKIMFFLYLFGIVAQVTLFLLYCFLVTGAIERKRGRGPLCAVKKEIKIRSYLKLESRWTCSNLSLYFRFSNNKITLNTFRRYKLNILRYYVNGKNLCSIDYFSCPIWYNLYRIYDFEKNWQMFLS